MRYEGTLYRPPSEANAYILQATIGCSWNKCVYCDMYRDKSYRVRALEETLRDISMAGAVAGSEVSKVFVADGDALGMTVEHWVPILERIREVFPRVRRVSCYAMASNILEKSSEELMLLRGLGLTRVYIGPESGDDVTLKRIAKGGTFDAHVRAAKALRTAQIEQSMIVLLGVGGTKRAEEHALRTADLITEMDPEFVSALTTTVVPGTPLARMQSKERFELPSISAMLGELRTIVDRAAPTCATFRTNHASNYLPLRGTLPHDGPEIVAMIDAALAGNVALRPEWSRGL